MVFREFKEVKEADDVAPVWMIYVFDIMKSVTVRSLVVSHSNTSSLKTSHFTATARMKLLQCRK